jgi:uncharacterized protein involved in copper resistance
LSLRLFNQPTELDMKKMFVAVCCAALMGSVSLASAQTTGQPGQDNMKTNDMDSNAKMMKKKHMKKGMMKGEDKGGMGMEKDKMSK